MRDLCAGALIRTCRLERNFSQEGLCRGICAASYLSKIEKGTVTPSEEIVQKLFAALNLTYTMDEAVLAPLRKAMDDCFALAWEEGDCSVLRAQITASRDLLLCSPLHLQCLLFDALCACQDGDLTRAHSVLSRLQAHLSQLDFQSLVRYHLLCGLSATDNARAGILRPRARPRAQRGNRLSPVLHALSGGLLSGSAPLCPAGLRPRRAVIEPLFTQDASETGDAPDAQAL